MGDTCKVVRMVKKLREGTVVTSHGFRLVPEECGGEFDDRYFVVDVDGGAIKRHPVKCCKRCGVYQEPPGG